MSTQYHIGKWNDILAANNVERIWSELHRIISKNKLARIQAKKDGLYDEGKFNYFADLTQELFMVLLSKGRFDYYIVNQMSDVEVEIEITQLELSNMLKKDIRKRQPEGFRLARRVSTILRNDTRFKQVASDFNTALNDRLYGLPHWGREIATASQAQINKAMENVPYIARDTRLTGRSGDSQIIVSNPDLAELIYKVLYEVLGLMTVKQIREAVMSRLPIMDAITIYVEDQNTDEDKPEFELEDVRATPEEVYMAKDSMSKVDANVDKFLADLFKAVKNKSKQHGTILKILYYFYIEGKLTQLDVARLLDMSDASVSGYRKTIEACLKNTGIVSLVDGLEFQKVLKAKVVKLLEL